MQLIMGYMQLIMGYRDIIVIKKEPAIIIATNSYQWLNYSLKLQKNYFFIVRYKLFYVFYLFTRHNTIHNNIRKL